jgi:plasmid rolling circle replication initiator protein Rep
MLVAATSALRLAQLQVELTGEELQDRRLNGKERPWKRYKSESLVIAEAYGLLGDSQRAARISDCGSFLKFAECPSGHERKLIGANFCRGRFCSMCSSRRALLISGQVRSVAHTALQRRPGLRFILITLTVPNVAGEWLGESVSDLYQAFKRLFRRVDVKRSVEGYFRALEVTYSKRLGNYHPHLHVLAAVDRRYFHLQDSFYISQPRWLEMWQDATGNPEITQVDVKALKPKKSGEDKLAGAAAEVAKYSVDPESIIQKQPKDTARVLGYLHDGLAGRRLAQYGGLLRQVKKELKLSDIESATSQELVEVGDDPSCICSVCRSKLFEHVYYWLGGNYVG